MLKLVARPAHSAEADLLEGYECEPLFLRDLAGQVTLRIDPEHGWTHDSLEAALQRVDLKAFVVEQYGAGAFLGGQWIGSSEV